MKEVFMKSLFKIVSVNTACLFIALLVIFSVPVLADQDSLYKEEYLLPPESIQVTLLYYGLYSNAHRGKMRKRGGNPSHPPIIEDETLYVPSRGWAEMIKKVYQIDPLIYPQCGGRMRIISFIEDHKVIDKIIAHLKLTFHAERPPPPQIVQKELLMAAEERDEYF